MVPDGSSNEAKDVHALSQCSVSFEMSSPVTFVVHRANTGLQQNFLSRARNLDILTCLKLILMKVCRTANALSVTAPFEGSSPSPPFNTGVIVTLICHMSSSQRQAAELLIRAGCLPCLDVVTPHSRESPHSWAHCLPCGEWKEFSRNSARSAARPREPGLWKITCGFQVVGN